MALRTSTSGTAILNASLLLSLALVLFLSLHCYHKDKDTNFNLFSRRLLVSTTELLPQGKKHHHHHHHHQKNNRHSQTVNVPVLPGNRPKLSPDPGDDEIDPRYGVQKRLVPTGPNPLHH